jgi:hypothetical protein
MMLKRLLILAALLLVPVAAHADGLSVPPCGSGGSITSAAGFCVQRDANGNAFANNFISGANSTASAGGTTVLTVASTRIQTLTGTLTQTYQMPDSRTLTVGSLFEFNNNSTSNLTIANAGGTTLYVLLPGGRTQVQVATNGTANGTWDIHSLIPSNSSWGTTGLGIGTLAQVGGLTVSNNGTNGLEVDTTSIAPAVYLSTVDRTGGGSSYTDMKFRANTFLWYSAGVTLGLSQDASGNITSPNLATLALADAATNTVSYPVIVKHTSSGTVAANFGAGIKFQNPSAAGTLRETGDIENYLSTATDGAEAGGFKFYTITAGVPHTLAATINSAGDITAVRRLTAGSNVVAGVVSSVIAGSMATDPTAGLSFYGKAGATNDLTFYNSSTVPVISIPAGSTQTFLSGDLFVGLTSTAQTNVVCFNTGTHLFTYQTWASGCVVSARRFKQDFSDITPDMALPLVMALHPESFRYKKSSGMDDGQRHYGLVADDVAKVFPGLVTYEKDGKTLHSVKYNELAPFLIAAIQKQQQEITALKSQLAILQKQGAN